MTDSAAMATALEALRKLIAAGALDPAVGAGLSRMGGFPGGGPPVPSLMAMGKATPPKVAMQIKLSKHEWGQTAEHWEDAQKAGKPRLLTVSRRAAQPRRIEALRGLTKQPPMDLNEYPPAMFQEGGAGASVRAVDRESNRGLGGYLRNICRDLPEGAVVERATDR